MDGSDMPISGEFVSTLQRSASMRAIDDIASGAIASIGAAPHSALASAHRTAPKLAPQDPAFLKDIARFGRSNLICEDDHNCFYRANVLARRANLLAGTGTSPAHDTFAGAVAILKAEDQSKLGWYFHASSVFNDAQRGLVMIDALYDVQRGGRTIRPMDPVPIADWAKRFSGRVEDIDIRSPYAGTGLTFNGNPEPIVTTDTTTWGFIRSELHKSWMDPRSDVTLANGQPEWRINI
jgi:hypothetical protein